MKGYHNRTDYQLVAEILETVKTWTTITTTTTIKTGLMAQSKSEKECKAVHISCSVNIPHYVLKRYLSWVIGQKLLVSLQSKAGRHYEISQQGMRYLEVFAKMQDDLQPLLSDEVLLMPELV